MQNGTVDEVDGKGDFPQVLCDGRFEEGSWVEVGREYRGSHSGGGDGGGSGRGIPGDGVDEDDCPYGLVEAVVFCPPGWDEGGECYPAGGEVGVDVGLGEEVEGNCEKDSREDGVPRRRRG